MIQAPPNFTGYRSKTHIGEDGCVKYTKEEVNLLKFFMSKHALAQLSLEEHQLYQLLWKYWGNIDRKCLFRLLGLPFMESEDRASLKEKLCTALGSKLVDLAVTVRFYLVTWKLPSAKPVTKNAHLRLTELEPKMYRVAAMLMSKGAYTQNKDFRDAVCIANALRTIVPPLYEEQIALASTNNNKERKQWLSDLMMQTYTLKKSCYGIIGAGETKSLLARTE